MAEANEKTETEVLHEAESSEQCESNQLTEKVSYKKQTSDSIEETPAKMEVSENKSVDEQPVQKKPEATSVAEQPARKKRGRKSAAEKQAMAMEKAEKTREDAMLALLTRMNERMDRFEEAQKEILEAGANKNRRESNLLSEVERRKQTKEEYKALNINLHNSGDVETDADKRYKELMLLHQANKSKTRLKGIVSQIGEANGNFVIRCFEEHDQLQSYPIIIPVEEFIYDHKEYNVPNGKKKLMEELVSRLGSTVDFMLYHIDEESGLAGASRMLAMSDYAVMNFLARKKDGKPEVVEGECIYADIVSVRKDKIKVAVKGVETTITGRDMGYRTFNRVHDKYRVGEKVLVKVNKIERMMYKGLNQEMPMVNLTCSVRDAEIDPAIGAFKTLHKGDYVLGTVINADEAGGMYVDLGTIDCKCDYPKVRDGRPIMKGDQIRIQITEMYEDTHMIRGAVVLYDR